MLYLAYRHPATPWYAKIFAAVVVGYAFSPIDLIPDFIPVLGYLDDILLVPLGITLALRMIPEEALNCNSCTHCYDLAASACHDRDFNVPLYPDCSDKLSFLFLIQIKGLFP
ncbi:MAG: hypothetical protein XE04_1567 [Marinimicrobia bacterium 46_43]|nr:MAG: hypothetical protein XE04_1567 [Marinimicrobia bacterium 46_43]